MISVYKRKRLEFITIVYWFLLLYIIAALVWWFIALEKQNVALFDSKVHELNKNSISYKQQYNTILQDKKRKTSQYIGEGSTFLLVILVGALFVYRATRRQLMLSRQQQNFMMAVTHELKTPIAIIKLNVETLEKRKLDEEKKLRLMETTLQETGRLNDLTTNILVTSQLESGNYQPDKEEINLSTLIEETVSDFSMRYPQRIIEKDARSEIYITGEQLLVQLLINNLLDNAIKYSPAEKPVGVHLDKHGHKVFLKVTDEGSGVPDDEKKQIFQKFYRSGSETTRKAKGTGLGLYLCKRIAESHRAKISVANNHPSGSIFNVEFKTKV